MARTLIKEIKDTRQNYLINGNFDVWQRGTSFNPSALGKFYTADRWGSYQYTASQVGIYQVAATTPNSTYGIKMQRQNGSTNTQPILLLQAIESKVLQPLKGKTITFSFYAKAGANFSAASSQLEVRIITGTGTDQDWASGYTGSSDVLLTQQVITTTMTKYTYTVTLASNINEMLVRFLYYGVGTAGADDTVTIEQVMLNEGSTAAPFKLFGDTIDGEIAACQRYYSKNFELTTAPTASTSKWIIYQVPVAIPNTGYLSSPTFFPHEMRAIPAVTLYGGEGIGNAGNIYVSGISRAASVERISTNMFSRVYNSSGVTWNINEQIIFNWTADAEL